MMRSEDQVVRAAAVPRVEGEERYFNRDLSWLEFNYRVLAQALDRREPLLERVKFLAIFSSNLDEFFMKRFALLRQRVQSPQADPEAVEMAVAVLPRVRERVVELEAMQARCWAEEIRPALAEAGIGVVDYLSLSERNRAGVDEWYRANVYPILTPLAVDPGHRFPFISNLSENLGVIVGRADSDERLFARIKIPNMLPRLVLVGEGTDRPTYVPLEQIILNNLDELFPGMSIHDVLVFRVTRSAVTAEENEEADDLLEQVETQLRLRRFASAVRVETPPNPSHEILSFITEELGLSKHEVFEREGPLDYGALFEIADLPRPEHRVRAWTPVIPPALSGDDVDIFAKIREQDILLHHPYESFRASVEKFVADAARDPDVLAIKQTLYRTSRDSPFVDSLVRAAERGKQVACLVELRARFDEDKNVRFARQLERAGVHVAYGVVGLKTHCKCSLVVRRETVNGRDALRSYAHLGTGNYHPKTSLSYTDLGLLTTNTDITDDVVSLFNVLTGRARPINYKRLIVAPEMMRDRFIQLIDDEITLARQGRSGRIIAKMNALEDRRITDKLYEASGAGVQVDLIVRGFCCARPGVPGLSENLRVRSVIGRFLEHSRVFYFGRGADNPREGWFGFGSADWMYRNLSDRVEAVCPVLTPDARARLWRILEIMLADCSQAWDLGPDGIYRERTPPPECDPNAPEMLGTFATLMRETEAGAR
ncbi:MAG: polyphosphate kinase 1 [Leptolyngbya sp. PLA3]|nr:MAG: polyphosphate kinase 1 [Cyanobacteria bacterium CYA]MCE7968895.1 polyphosphate kinase 1 [Leptolyngbya sp. PL-A3]